MRGAGNYWLIYDKVGLRQVATDWADWVVKRIDCESLGGRKKELEIYTAMPEASLWSSSGQNYYWGHSGSDIRE